MGDLLSQSVLKLVHITSIFFKKKKKKEEAALECRFALFQIYIINSQRVGFTREKSARYISNRYKP